ncbi:MAG: TadE/TadG family type IV pilus assembly protein [Rhizomicrobium sp.]|jgi:Flp pilus assembly protein TadG
MKRALSDTRGITAVEFGMTAPMFMVLLFMIVQASMALWTELGISHGAAMAARCRTILPTTCSTADATKAYAVSESFGLGVPPSTFTVTTPACGNQVNASYVYSVVRFVFGTPSVTLTAQSCFPK